MIFTEVRENETFIHIDGYSNKKTLNGALKELAKEVARYNELEASTITDAIKFGEEILVNTEYYIVEAEEVGCATRYINDEEAEYKEANYYLHIMFQK